MGGMVDPMEDMVRAAMNQNINVIDLMKPNAILHHVLFHRIIVRTGKRKYVKSLLKWFLFQLKDKIVMTKTRKCASLSNGLSLSKSKSTYILRNADLYLKPYVTMLIKNSFK